MKILTATKLKLGFSALVVAGAATAFVVQNQAQEKLRAQNDSLTQQLAQLQSDNDSLSNRLTTVAVAKSLPDDKLNELLQLRGEVGVLRRQASDLGKLRTENQQLRQGLDAAKGQIARQNTAAQTQDPAKQHEIDVVNAMKQLGLAMRIYAGDNFDKYATNFDLLTNYLGGATKFIGNIPLDDFEFVNIGVVNDKFPSMIMFREKVATRSPDGNWRRVYGLADGSVQTAASYDGNFDAWEKQNTYTPPPNQ